MSTPAVSGKPRPSSKEQVVSHCERTANTDVCTPQWMANQGELFQEMIDFINFASCYIWVSQNYWEIIRFVSTVDSCTWTISLVSAQT